MTSQLLEPAADTQPGDLFRGGQLTAAIAAQTARVKADPAKQAERLFLFELLVFNGDVERAGRQIQAIDYSDPALDGVVAVYRRLLDAERTRRGVLAGETRPQFLLAVPPHAELRLQAIAALQSGNAASALQLLTQAAEQSPAVQGQVNERPFSLLVDCDDIFGGLLEVVSGTGAYFWLPLEQIASLEVEAPRFPRDLIWASATLELVDGQQGDVFLPVLYPDSYRSDDEQVRLGRKTDWHTIENGPTIGRGMRTLLADDEPLAALALRSLRVTT